MAQLLDKIYNYQQMIVYCQRKWRLLELKNREPEHCRFRDKLKFEL